MIKELLESNIDAFSTESVYWPFKKLFVEWLKWRSFSQMEVVVVPIDTIIIFKIY